MFRQQLLVKTCFVLCVLLMVLCVERGDAGHAKKKKVIIHVPVHKKIQKHVHTIIKHVHHHHKPIVIKDEKIIHEEHHPIIKNEHVSHEHLHHHHEKHQHPIHIAKENFEVEEEHIHHHHNYEHKISDHNDSLDSPEGFD